MTFLWGYMVIWGCTGIQVPSSELLEGVDLEELEAEDIQPVQS